METRIKKRIILKSEALLRYFLGDERMVNLVMCTPNNIEIFAYDSSVYEALGSLELEERNVLSKVIKLMETVNILSYSAHFKKPKPVLTQERVKEIRNMITTESWEESK